VPVGGPVGRPGRNCYYNCLAVSGPPNKGGRGGNSKLLTDGPQPPTAVVQWWLSWHPGEKKAGFSRKSIKLLAFGLHEE